MHYILNKVYNRMAKRFNQLKRAIKNPLSALPLNLLLSELISRIKNGPANDIQTPQLRSMYAELLSGISLELVLSELISRIKNGSANSIQTPQLRSMYTELLSGISLELVLSELISRIKNGSANDIQKELYANGYHFLPKHYYLPIPDDTDDLDNFWGVPSQLKGIDMNPLGALELLEKIAPPYLAEFRELFSMDSTGNDEEFHLNNGSYMAVDAHIYYLFIRHYKPKNIIEIGNGNSTKLAVAAGQVNQREFGKSPHLTSIDPYPSPIFKDGYKGLNKLIVKKVQDTPLSYYESLESGDILFIDSSHVIRSGNDVHYEFLEILPRLKSGVLIHIHDISLPMPYPKVYYDTHFYWNEQYLLQAFLAFNDSFEVIWPGNFMMVNYPEKMLEIFPEFAHLRQRFPQCEPTAFWIRVK